MIWLGWSVQITSNGEYGEDEREVTVEEEMEAELEMAEHEGRLLNQMKTGEKRLNDHKNFLAKCEAVKQFGLGLHFFFCNQTKWQKG